MGNYISATDLTTYIDEARLIGLCSGDATKAWTAAENATARALADEYIDIAEMELDGLLKCVYSVPCATVSDELMAATANVALHRLFCRRPEYRRVWKQQYDEAMDWAESLRDSQGQIGASGVTESSGIRTSVDGEDDEEIGGTLAGGGLDTW